MPEPQPIPKGNVQKAMERAEHYRLLNEPEQAESICRDIVSVDPENEKAWIHLLLSLSDQFPKDKEDARKEATEALVHIKSDFLNHYYQGIIHERWGRANMKFGHGHQAVMSWISKAMQSYQKAIELAPADDPDPTLRWNTCVRLMEKLSKSAPPAQPAAKRDMHGEYDEVPQRRRSSNI